ncbi:predicted protein [Sclerotinia sclerotiorum 1980 UF-70]|uniref:Uncharacterized protein n=1 Tax=Sclerotinia sclerotiorum (strain ATCC 18683 / 1980 / Ss-1) TaxID=665079 RepID=A7ETC2_SCLS1|nr:predicted protein [Sclerotinia sclerotiorum 1980 UF-70]EDN92714.1 predicted protein [Sclerotinia sclerotiorum 1980 UF-70]
MQASWLLSSGDINRGQYERNVMNIAFHLLEIFESLTMGLSTKDMMDLLREARTS